MEKEMKEIYHVQGKLCKNFVGQISYTVCLEKSYEELDIEFSFHPKHFSRKDISKELSLQIRDYCQKEYGYIPKSEQEWENALLKDMKTEIHTLASLNDQFIGGIHRQLTTRHMHYSRDSVSKGCIPVFPIEGVLKVTILAFSVLLDNTEYVLTVRAR